MTAAEKQDALEALMRSSGWALVVKELEDIQEKAVNKLTGIVGADGAAESPVHAARYRLAEQVAKWPVEQVEQIIRTREQQGETYA